MSSTLDDLFKVGHTSLLYSSKADHMVEASSGESETQARNNQRSKFVHVPAHSILQP